MENQLFSLNQLVEVSMTGKVVAVAADTDGRIRYSVEFRKNGIYTGMAIIEQDAIVRSEAKEFKDGQ